MFVSSQTAVKGGHGFEIAVRMENWVAGTGTRYKIKAIVFEVCIRDQACFRLFLCLISSINIEIHTWIQLIPWNEEKSRFDETLEL